MPSWVIPVAAIVGVIGQLWGGLWIAARAAGVTQEKMKAHGARILTLEVDSKDHGERIATIEGRLTPGRM